MMEVHTAVGEDPWFLKSKSPAFWPANEALTLPEGEFQSYLARLKEPKEGCDTGELGGDGDDTETFTLVSAAEKSTTADIREALAEMDVNASKPDREEVVDNDHPFMKGLLSYEQNASVPPNMENKMLTQNGDVTFRSTNDALVDLFAELEDVVSGPRLFELLNAAWQSDPLATLKIIFNARSIHLGKASRPAFYRSAGWLAQYHPLTLAANLRWLSRPVIETKAESKGDEGGNDGTVLVEPEKDEHDIARFDVKHGVAHGYWKDLLNLLALSANGKLDVLANATDILNVERVRKGRHLDERAAKERRGRLRHNRHAAALAAWEERPVHRALHLTVARLFAEQLRADLALLRGDDARARGRISLCAKWAPSLGGFHDKHTFVASSIAEILHPEASLPDLELPKTGDERADRELYLRYAREAYRKDVSALRAYLEVVERDITAESFAKIKYERVPSVAMKNYQALFAKKDIDRFEAYLEKVATGETHISGATLMPSTLVSKAVALSTSRSGGAMSARLKAIGEKAVDGQWRSLVERVRASGSLESCLAVCDVSGSMQHPVFRDGTCPQESAVGLSLLVAEVAAPPFGGAFVTFSSRPTVQRVNLAQSFVEKVNDMRRADWDMNTDFVAVFEDLILPMAVTEGLTPEQMVKRVLVFSDMQFDKAEVGVEGRGWASSFERVSKAYRKAGYEMPQLVFWNLAGGSGGEVAPKPVTADQQGTALVSGYSQGMLKVFMDKGLDGIAEETAEEGEGGDDEDDDGFAVVGFSNKRQKLDPITLVRKAIGHKAYDMLKVVD
ncbi:hypothetical protein QBC33DRAFT_491751 [Phialemonium atrogriseum]|uniref:DUF2828 domain-containing protein n=1 Tax=Phialemonium atrogriseum TaxID=1093897 RepID=A0AAJ0C2D0_9PEZI|nr:uncharacterized protein QBC33DRAFT_491751 [Phialemonium atrogriseum]KAK1767449.1 hypothetical protein QBC33DRAFT_491751 [Phialemonium atrogriseum]